MPAGRRRILVVEDDSETAERLVESLATGGYQVDLAVDGNDKSGYPNEQAHRPDELALERASEMFSIAVRQAARFASLCHFLRSHNLRSAKAFRNDVTVFGR
jgi:hypothetical protein